MKKTTALLVSLLLPLLAACGNQQQETPASSLATSQRTRATTGSALVDMPAGDIASGKAVGMAATQSISGNVDVKESGTILGFDVQIGNYGKTSDGTLVVKLCEGSACSEGSTPIATSADNQYLEIPLSQVVAVTQGSQLHYTLTRAAGTSPFAVWTYADAAATTIMPDGSNEPRVPKIGLRYKK